MRCRAMIDRLLIPLALAPCLICIPAAARSATTTVYIVSTGDIHEHSQYLPRIASYIKYMKRTHANVVAFDCGDALTDYAKDDPNNGDLWKLKTSGNAMYRAMAKMGYDVFTVGNHDECYGMAQLASLMGKWKLSFMGVNLVKSPVSLPLITPPVYRFEHVSVGVVGTVSTHFWHLPAADKPSFDVAGVRSGRVTSAINAIKGKANIVVLLTHEVDDDDRDSADKLWGVSVIAGGHSHTTLYEYRKKRGDRIVKAGWRGRYVSVLELTWDWQKKSIVAWSRQLVDMEKQKFEDPEVKSLLRAPLVKQNDYDGDGRSELAVYDPSSGVLRAVPADGGAENSWTLPCGGECVPVHGDFDGDAKTDPAVFDRATGEWTILMSGSGYSAATRTLGGENASPMPGDYDGDLVTDIAVYEAGRGVLTAELSDAGGEAVSAPLGGPGYAPAQGYYDDDGLTDPVVYREEDGVWAGLMSGSEYAPVAAKLGGGGRDPVPGYYDADGPVDPAVYDEASGDWTAMLSGVGYSRAAAKLGGPGWTAVASDYDGDGREDPAVYREEDGSWILMRSGSGYEEASLTLGGPGWIPVR